MKTIFLTLFILVVHTVFAQNGELKFIQGTDTIPVTGERNIVQIDKKPFSIQFFTKPYQNKKKKAFATQVAVMQFLGVTPKVGDKISELSFYSPGTGLAAEDSGYSSTFIDADSHHYLIYTDEKDRRVNLIEKKDDILLVEWKINQFFFNQKDISVEASDFGSLYFIFLRNSNFNETIDEGELMVIKVEFTSPA